MDKKFTEYCDDLQKEIQRAYSESPTIDEAEKLAAKFLDAQMRTANELQVSDLDARMKKSGVKAIRAAVYMGIATKGEKKPSDVMIEAAVNMDELVQTEQKGLDAAEVERDLLHNYLSVFREAHIYFRGISKGRFE